MSSFLKKTTTLSIGDFLSDGVDNFLINP